VENIIVCGVAKMEEKEISLLESWENEILSIHNKIQEAQNLERDGKWFHADTKLQGLKQKVLNLYEVVKTYRNGLQNENNSNT